MSDIPAALRDQVILRASNRCEYCELSQTGQEATFHIDHVIPRNAAGATERWLAAARGVAKPGVTTDQVMTLTRGEP